MSFSKEFRYRNLGMQRESRRGRSGPPGCVLLIAAAVLLVCALCGGLAIGYEARSASASQAFTLPNPFASAPKATATPDTKSTVPLRAKGLNENGLELTVVSFQRPLEVKGLAKPVPSEQFVLVSVTVRNTKTTGQPLKIDPADFKLKGDGGLVYDANPKTVTMDGLLSSQDTVGPNKSVDRDLIYQIAVDDTGLKLYWTVGKTTRLFLLETEK